MPIRLTMAADSKPDLLMFLTDDNAYTVPIENDAKGEFVILPPEVKPRRKNRKIYLNPTVEQKKTGES